MKRLILMTLAGLIVLAYIGSGIHYIVSREHKVQFQEVKLKSTTSDLKQLQLKYDLLNSNLDKELQKNDTDGSRVKQLEDEKQDLEKQKQELQSQLQAKLDAKQAEQDRIAAAERSLSVTATASAATPSNGAKAFIYQHESGNNPGAINKASGACGLGQALPCSKMPCSLSDYACQDAFFTDYAVRRYGGWDGAYQFWLAHSWW